MAVYKTPGVYIEEIPNLPASIVPVETAIPAFVGYTEKAERGGKSITNVPTTVSSLLDFQRYFGAGPKLDNIEVELDTNDNVKNATRMSSTSAAPRFRLFDSLRLFWDNGGGDAIIVSVGDYSSTKIDSTALGTGIDMIKKVDRPTMILFPDGVDLDSSVQLGDLQAKTLMQCTDLQDRVGVFDFKESSEDAWQDDVDSFRNRVGNQNLKYGAVYAPHLITSYPIDIGFRHISIKGQTKVTFVKDKLAKGDPAIAKTVDALDGAVSAADSIHDYVETEDQPKDALANQWGTLLNALGPTATASENVFKKAFDFLAAQLEKLDGWATEFLGDSLRTASATALENLAETCLPKLIALHGLLATTESAEDDKMLCDYADTTYKKLDDSHWKLASKDLSKPGTTFKGETDVHTTGLGTNWASQRFYTIKVIDELFGKIIEAMNNIHGAAVTLESAQESRLRETLPKYAAIAESSIRLLQRMPPSGAIAGVYAQVDNARGVWKAPANVSINQVQGLTRYITAKQQENLNVDADSGKSINAIRFFHGKGHLVWGARTLMGNDNEWRYVSVRRYYNFVEESVAKAMAPVVFEPNDATTWARVKTMIENFLLGQWRQGALMGSKPDQAFFVNVGLNVTMTPLDVLEGRLIIVVGMSVVRPAEFIILRFMHMLPAA
jgi:phage tail sheath protein FI